MGLELDIGCFRDNHEHGEDAFAISRGQNAFLVVVADGVSGSTNGSFASTTVVSAAKDAFKRCYSENAEGYASFDSFIETFDSLLEQKKWTREEELHAETTATLVVFEGLGQTRRVVAKYYAYGDSPIYVAYPEEISPDYPNSFLVLQVHAKPLMTDGGTVYSYIDVGKRAVVGRAAIGSFELRHDDICLIMTDGVPVRNYIYRDFGEGGSNHRFLNKVRSSGARAGATFLQKWLNKDKSLGDDATLVVVRVRETA